MAIYDFRCEKCNIKKEIILFTLTDTDENNKLITCEQCGTKMVKDFSTASFSFKNVRKSETIF